jgi:hypothetical protein
LKKESISGNMDIRTAAPPSAGNSREIDEERAMLRAILQILGATASIAGIVGGVCSVISLAINIWQGTALLEAARIALEVGLIFGGMIALMAIFLLFFSRICPNCWLPTMAATGATRMEQAASLGGSYEQKCHEYKCEGCGRTVWVAETEG